MKSLLHLTVKEIKTGALKTILPELYELKKVYETGSWHNHQQVFEHILRVFSYFSRRDVLDHKRHYQRSTSEAGWEAQRPWLPSSGPLRHPSRD